MVSSITNQHLITQLLTRWKRRPHNHVGERIKVALYFCGTTFQVRQSEAEVAGLIPKDTKSYQLQVSNRTERPYIHTLTDNRRLQAILSQMSPNHRADFRLKLVGVYETYKLIPYFLPGGQGTYHDQVPENIASVRIENIKNIR